MPQNTVEITLETESDTNAINITFKIPMWILTDPVLNNPMLNATEYSLLVGAIQTMSPNKVAKALLMLIEKIEGKNKK